MGIFPLARTASRKIKGVSRFSVSLEHGLLERLDQMAARRRMPSRSAAIAEMIHHQLVNHYEHEGNRVMAGTLTLVFENKRQRVQGRLSDIKRRYFKEVIATQ